MTRIPALISAMMACVIPAPEGRNLSLGSLMCQSGCPQTIVLGAK